MTPELFDLTGKVALVTGGNAGLGRAMALGLVAAGARVAVTGRDAAKNEAIARELGSASLVVTGDVREEPSVEAAVEEVVARFGHIDVLVNNAGNYIGGSVLDLDVGAWHSVLDTHLTGAFLCSKHASRVMVSQGRGGKIINIGSMYSLFGPPAGAPYATAKTGMIGLTRALAVELAEHGIQVNAILPGWYETELTRGGPASDWGERIRRKTPAARWGEPEDLVGAVVFFAAPASDFVTGTALPVDGGYAVTDRELPE
jgi:2-deoxy-D-gluconate 3-dehydrogenase